MGNKPNYSLTNKVKHVVKIKRVNDKHLKHMV